MPRKSGLFLCVGLWFSGLCPPLAAADSVKRIAVVVGHNEGNSKETKLKYAESDARNMASVLQEMGGFDQVNLILSPSAAVLRAGIKDARMQMKSWQAQPSSQGVLFFFFYSGHADARALHLGAELINTKGLLAQFEKLGAKLRVVVLDACQSGSVIRRKGVIVREAVKVRLVDELDVSGQAILASTSQGENAQESDDLRGSFFSRHLVTGLRGAADGNSDGAVSLQEAYQYAFHHTLHSTAMSAAGLQHPSFKMELSGKREVLLTWPGRSLASLQIHARSDGRCLVVSKETGAVMVELHLNQNQVQRIGLPRGDYLLKKRSPNGLRTSQIFLEEGTRLEIDEQDMKLADYSRLAIKGETSPRHFAWRWALGTASVLAVGLGTTFEVLAAQDRDQRDQLLADSRAGIPVAYDQLADLDHRAHQREWVGHILLGSAAGLGAAALWLWLADDSPSPALEPDRRQSAQLLIGYRQLQLQFSF